MQSHATRKQAKSTYAAIYTFFQHNPKQPFTCFYCGELANGVDHVPPLSRVDDYRALKLRHEFFIKVPCCQECNSMLQNSLQLTISERVFYAHDLIEKKYKKHLKCKVWTADEIKYAEFRGRLKSYIVASEAMRKYAAARIDYWKGLNAFMEEFNPDDNLELSERLVKSRKR